jgi:DNA-directed RNA polymerase subunit alpha
VKPPILSRRASQGNSRAAKLHHALAAFRKPSTEKKFRRHGDFLGADLGTFCYTPRQLILSRWSAASVVTTAKILWILQTRGGTPAMSRVPLNQSELDRQGLQQRLEMSTAEIGLAVRTTNCLEEKGIFTVDDLLNCRREDLLSISNFGEKTLKEVYKALERIGFKRPDEPSSPGVPR